MEGTPPDTFWSLASTEEITTIDAVLARRFPSTHASLTGALEAIDPFRIVYPDNPGEYSDVVREILVLTAGVNADLRRLPGPALEAVLAEALTRCFGEEPPVPSVQRLAERLHHDSPSTNQPGTVNA